MDPRPPPFTAPAPQARPPVTRAAGGRASVKLTGASLSSALPCPARHPMRVAGAGKQEVVHRLPHPHLHPAPAAARVPPPGVAGNRALRAPAAAAGHAERAARHARPRRLPAAAAQEAGGGVVPRVGQGGLGGAGGGGAGAGLLWRQRGDAAPLANKRCLSWQVYCRSGLWAPSTGVVLLLLLLLLQVWEKYGISRYSL